LESRAFSSISDVALIPLLSYIYDMSANPKLAFRSSFQARSSRLRDALAVQAIEDNPLDGEQVAMFEMFERENWPHEKRRTYLMARASKSTQAD
jgi:hypothetical protein